MDPPFWLITFIFWTTHKISLINNARNNNNNHNNNNSNKTKILVAVGAQQQQ
ncbi:hypothetical protein ACRALDRAFT_2020568 [Sodiomyces alcalophilus JCM 7366]|uniref:uncharacterized protein n=1 Tax=Sodiomyces alcalophilus JCM 7366 TaxID=591952 RepID=UPI0039B3CC77